METIQVRINPDGTAREVNPLGEEPTYPQSLNFTQRLVILVKWEEAEAQLRTFEIDSICPICHDKCCYIAEKLKKFELGSTHPAEITDTYPEPQNGLNGKVRIIQ